MWSPSFPTRRILEVLQRGQQFHPNLVRSVQLIGIYRATDLTAKAPTAEVFRENKPVDFISISSN
jgi:hypothetical protein